ncbi:MAG: V-type ATP synthase subunit B, partial [Actinobacteria bacterium]|nr:V-type ATP synthase subunit B [Actinomycetota bacterium]
MLKEYKSITAISGPLLHVEGVEGVKYDELVDIKLDDGSIRSGRVLEVNRDNALVQVFEGTFGI